MKPVLLVVSAMFLGGCAGKTNYQPPSSSMSIANTVTISSPRDQVWSRIIPALENSSFVAKDLDKDSGFIYLSYSGNPEKYIDCGHIESNEKNARGERKYNFPAATADKEYEISGNDSQVWRIRRKMHLDGNISISVQDAGNGSTLVSVNTEYVVTKYVIGTDSQDRSQSFMDRISFNTNGSASFPQKTTCSATGALEKEVLDTLNM